MSLRDATGHRLLWAVDNPLECFVEVSWRPLVIFDEVDVFSILIELGFSTWCEDTTHRLVFWLLTLILFGLILVVVFIFVVERLVVFDLIESLLDVKSLKHLPVLLSSRSLLESLLHLLLSLVLSLELVVPMLLLALIKAHCFRHVL